MRVETGLYRSIRPKVAPARNGTTKPHCCRSVCRFRVFLFGTSLRCRAASVTQRSYSLERCTAFRRAQDTLVPDPGNAGQPVKLAAAMIEADIRHHGFCTRITQLLQRQWVVIDPRSLATVQAVSVNYPNSTANREFFLIRTCHLTHRRTVHSTVQERSAWLTALALSCEWRGSHVAISRERFAVCGGVLGTLGTEGVSPLL